jgi:hypothetical protein
MTNATRIFGKTRIVCGAPEYFGAAYGQSIAAIKLHPGLILALAASH